VHIPLQAKDERVARYRRRATADEAQNNAIYAAMIESVDQSVGRIVKKLDELRIADRTMVIFTSDNGGLAVKEGPNTPATSNAPLRAGKGYLYEGGLRVPLIVRWPGVAKAASTCDVPVFSADLYSTVVEAAGAGENTLVDGQSLLPLLKQEEGFKSRALYWHYPHYSNQGGRPSGAIREGDWKLLEFFEDGRTELYNLRDDPAETKDLAMKTIDKVTALESKLIAWRGETGAKMPAPNPDYAGAKAD
jgi:arylsulfatase A